VVTTLNATGSSLVRLPVDMLAARSMIDVQDCDQLAGDWPAGGFQ
jgi:hypothetical protein